MTIFLVTFVVMGIAILAMAVGVLVGRRPIGGSCGGLERLGLECDAACDKPCPRNGKSPESPFCDYAQTGTGTIKRKS
jgi:uncharacterized protein